MGKIDPNEKTPLLKGMQQAVEDACNAVKDAVSGKVRGQWERNIFAWLPTDIHAGEFNAFKESLIKLVRQKKDGYDFDYTEQEVRDNFLARSRSTSHESVLTATFKYHNIWPELLSFILAQGTEAEAWKSDEGRAIVSEARQKILGMGSIVQNANRDLLTRMNELTEERPTTCCCFRWPR